MVEDITLYAWLVPLNGVTHHPKGSELVSINLIYGNVTDDISLLTYTKEPYYCLPTPNIEGYIFDGWYTEKEGGNRVLNTDICTGAITLYAHFLPIE